MSLDDTHPAIRRAQVELLRQMSPGQRVAIAEELTAVTMRLSRDAIRAQMPGAPESRVLLRWIELVYGKDLAARIAPFADLLGVRP